MAQIEVVMPQMGESITEGTIVKWHKKPGEQVTKDETLLEITTDKVDSEISAPASGTVARIMAEENVTVPVRTPIAVIETEQPVAQAAAPPPETSPAPTHAEKIPATHPAAAEAAPAAERKKEPPEAEAAPPRPEPAPASPRVETPPQTAPAASAAQTAPATADIAELRKKYPAPLFDVVPMTNLQQKMAAHMVRSVATSPHVAAHHEADLTAIVRHRAENLAAFESREGFRLTYTPYIIEAVIKALQKFPLVNCSLEGTTIIKKNFINLGVAVASESGLIVPVIKHAEEKNFLGLARAVNDLVNRTRSKKLAPDDVQGGTFTITNYGIFGTTIGTPIINQPQVAILGTGAIRPRVSVVNDSMAIRSIAYFTLSFDHRIIDGELGARFLEDVIGRLQQFDAALKF